MISYPTRACGIIVNFMLLRNKRKGFKYHCVVTYVNPIQLTPVCTYIFRPTDLPSSLIIPTTKTFARVHVTRFLIFSLWTEILRFDHSHKSFSKKRPKATTVQFSFEIFSNTSGKKITSFSLPIAHLSRRTVEPR